RAHVGRRWVAARAPVCRQIGGSGFFFQAEDGIRGFHVTGVQTCALPISRQRVRLAATPDATSASAWDASSNGRLPTGASPTTNEIGRASCGKECRSRWGGEDLNKELV